MAAIQPAKGDSPAAGKEEDGYTKRSFAQVLGKTMKNDLEDKPTDSTTFRKEGSLALRLSDSDVSRGESHVSNHVVVLKFSSFRSSLDSIRDSIHRFWEISGEFIMGLIDPRHVVVYLQSDDEVKKVLSKDSYTIRGVRYKIFRWHPGFSLRADPELAPLWIELPNLPFAFFLPAIMKAIGDSFGSFLRIDDGTRFFARPKVARMCIEMDVTKPLPHRIWLESPQYEGYWQKLEYPGFKYCDHCSLIGHEKDYCRKLVSKKNDHLNDVGVNHKENKSHDKNKQKQNQVGGNQGQNIYKQRYVPISKKTMEIEEQIGVSGAKNSQGVEIINEQQGEKKVKAPEKSIEKVTLANKFGVLAEENSDGVGKGIEEQSKMEEEIKRSEHKTKVNKEDVENTENILKEAGYTISEVKMAMLNKNGDEIKSAEGSASTAPLWIVLFVGDSISECAKVGTNSAKTEDQNARQGALHDDARGPKREGIIQRTWDGSINSESGTNIMHDMLDSKINKLENCEMQGSSSLLKQSTSDLDQQLIGAKQASRNPKIVLDRVDDVNVQKIQVLDDYNRLDRDAVSDNESEANVSSNNIFDLGYQSGEVKTKGKKKSSKNGHAVGTRRVTRNMITPGVSNNR